MDVTMSIKGGLEVQRRFQTAGDRVRKAVAFAFEGLLSEGQAEARSRAPRGSPRPGQKYPAGRLREGIITWCAGTDEFPSFPNNGNAATNKEMAKYARMANSGNIVGVLLSTWYTGRFFERGVNKPRTWVGPDERGTGYNAYNKSFRQTIRNSMKKGGVTQERFELAESRAIKAATRASLKVRNRFKRVGFYRKQRLPQVQFMAPARALMESKFEQRVQSLVDQAVQRGS
jgi:hypothetical protein